MPLFNPPLRTKIITLTRDLTVASGNVAYPGAGFKPSALIVTGGEAAGYTNYTTLTGFSDAGLLSRAISAHGAAFTPVVVFLMFSDAGVTNFQTAVVASYDADGFTLTWAKTGSPTGTATAHVLCLG